MRSADGGQPGRKTSTFTTRWTGVEVGRSLGTMSDGICGLSVTFSRYARSSSGATPIGFRMPGTLEVTAQSPNETSVVVLARTNLILWRSSSLETAASTRQTSTPSGNSLKFPEGVDVCLVEGAV